MAPENKKSNVPPSREQSPSLSDYETHVPAVPTNLDPLYDHTVRNPAPSLLSATPEDRPRIRLRPPPVPIIPSEEVQSQSAPAPAPSQPPRDPNPFNLPPRDPNAPIPAYMAGIGLRAVPRPVQDDDSDDEPSYGARPRRPQGSQRVSFIEMPETAPAKAEKKTKTPAAKPTPAKKPAPAKKPSSKPVQIILKTTPKQPQCPTPATKIEDIMPHRGPDFTDTGFRPTGKKNESGTLKGHYSKELCRGAPPAGCTKKEWDNKFRSVESVLRKQLKALGESKGKLDDYRDEGWVRDRALHMWGLEVIKKTKEAADKKLAEGEADEKMKDVEEAKEDEADDEGDGMDLS